MEGVRSTSETSGRQDGNNQLGLFQRSKLSAGAEEKWAGGAGYGARRAGAWKERDQVSGEPKTEPAGWGGTKRAQPNLVTEGGPSGSKLVWKKSAPNTFGRLSLQRGAGQEGKARHGENEEGIRVRTLPSESSGVVSSGKRQKGPEVGDVRRRACGTGQSKGKRAGPGNRRSRQVRLTALGRRVGLA